MTDQRIKQGSQTRSRILKATQHLIEHKGIDQLTTRSIAAKAGISQSSLYHHFSGVDQVLLVSMKEQAEKKLEIFKQKSFVSPLDYLVAAFEFSLKQLAQQKGGGYLAVMERARRDAVFKKEVQRLRNNMFLQMKEDLQSYFKNPLEAKGLDQVILGFSLLREGMINQWQFYGDSAPFDVASEGIHSILSLLCDQLKEQAQ